MINSAWPLVIILLMSVGLAGPTLLRVLRESSEREIVEAEERRERVRQEILAAQPDWDL